MKKFTKLILPILILAFLIYLIMIVFYDNDIAYKYKINYGKNAYFTNELPLKIKAYESDNFCWKLNDYLNNSIYCGDIFVENY